MRIVIEYDSSWRNSILKDFKKEPIEKRNFKASSKSKEPIDVKDITINTVLGVLCRLIGDQRKLYQAKSCEDFFFKGMEITFEDITCKRKTWNETAFLINKSENRPPQSAFIGVLDKDEPLFFSKYSATLWSVLDYDFIELLDFINNPSIDIKDNTVSPRHILNRIRYGISEMDRYEFIDNRIEYLKDKLNSELSKPKPREKTISQLNETLANLNFKSKDSDLIAFERKLKDAVNKLCYQHPEQSYFEKNGSIYPSRLYAGALYLMVNEMHKKGIDVSDLVSKKGVIKGFSKVGFNGVRDFLNPLMGNRKKTTHTPYPLTKASGQLEINLDIDINKAKELKIMIDNAGVSSFYLGKKGLAYVSDIRLH